MYRYYKGVDKKDLIIRADDYIERYDKSKKIWVKDWSLLQIYTGDILTDVITETEAKKIIEQLK